MTVNSGSGFDSRAAGRDAGEERLEEETRHLAEEDTGDDAIEALERKLVEDRVNDAF